jgi:hypothetical protein
VLVRVKANQGQKPVIFCEKKLIMKKTSVIFLFSKINFVLFVLQIIIMDQEQEQEKKIGLQKDGSVVVDEKNDYCAAFLKTLDWKRPLRTTTSDIPWINEEDWKQSAAFRYMTYQQEEAYINPDNPILNGENVRDLRKDENRTKSSKASKAAKDFSVTHQAVTEMTTTGEGYFEA